MNYRIEIKKKGNLNFQILDIFEATTLKFDLDFYDAEQIDKIKVPISIDLTLPMTDNNISVIEYDPSSATINTLPVDPFDIKVYSNGVLVLEGDMYVESYSYNNLTPVIDVRIVDKIQEIFRQANNVVMSELYSDYNTNLDFDVFLATNAGSIDTMPTMESVMYPYVDFANDINKFNYEARQFIQFGYDKQKAGLPPVFKVSDFIERYFNEVNINVISRFFRVGNYSSPISGIDPDYLYMLTPARLKGSTRTRIREFTLREGNYNKFFSIFTRDSSATQTNVRSSNFGLGTTEDTTGSWNWHITDTNAKQTDYGIERQNSIPNDQLNLTRAYFGSNESYTSVPNNTVRQIPNYIQLELEMIQLATGNYWAIKNIDIANSNAKFVVKAILWVDGYPRESFRMCNSNGSVKELDISSATNINPGSSSSIEVSNGTSFDIPDQNLTSLNDALRWNSAAVGDYIWEQKEFEVEAGSAYSYSIEFELISGEIRYEYVNSWQYAPSGDPYPDTTAFVTGGSEMFVKMTFAESVGSNASQVGALYLELNSVNNTFNPYFGDDQVNLYFSLREFDNDIKPSALLKSIVSRYNLSVVYDQKSNSIIIDRLPDIRSQNSVVDISSALDDNQDITVEVVRKIAKSIEIEGPQNLFFDNFGYGSVDLNSAGSDELKFDLNSGFYNTSLCGDELFEEIPEGFNQYEIGLTLNSFTSADDIPLTFMYLDKPLFRTNVKRARFIDKDDYKNLIYDTLRSHIFIARARTERPNSMKLYYFDQSGNTTDLYNFFVGNDNIQFYAKPTISFTALMEEDYIYDIKNKYSVINMPLTGGKDIVIKSVSGELYEGGIYSTIEGIIL
jgi:hypothetical protein